ncbi:MAG: SpoIID/LytB domain-containing protein [Vampirovibrio sp.]|nr:SpoIID/LytB domain-containing protein [Vampirovibrio sp.]
MMSSKKDPTVIKHRRSIIAVAASLLLLGSAAFIYSQQPAQHPSQPNKDTASCAAPDPSLLPKPETFADADLIRVGISSNSMQDYEYPHAALSANKPFRVVDHSNGKALFQGAAWQQVRFSVSKSGFYARFPGHSKASGPYKGPLRVIPTTPDGRVRVTSITRHGKIPSYKGMIEITRGYSSPKKLSVINILSTQEYLKAVVPNELPIRFGYEAVKAQSIAARNYAIRPREKFWPQFDICDSQYCQVYFGSQTENRQTNQALKETQGLLALYQGEPILALYSSAHGGHSESYTNAFSEPRTNIFPAEDIPYLRGFADIPQIASKYGDLSTESAARKFWTSKSVKSYDVLSNRYRWQKRWSVWTLSSTLNKTLVKLSKEKNTKDFVIPAFKPGQSVGRVKRIEVTKRGVSGKIMEMRIQGTGGTWTVKKEFVIRKALTHGNRMLPSANVVFSHLSDKQGKLVTLVADGGGFGHGVGMSQYGASYLSKHGKPFSDIIQHYYKGVAIGSIPLQVGKGHHQKPVKTTFYGKTDKAILKVETEKRPFPVLAELNGQLYSMDDPTAYPVPLRKNQLNTLVLYPDPCESSRVIKVWAELFPSKAN